MVKKFIKGILGKNEDKPASEESKSDNDVPDELPALAEDTMEEEKKEEKPEEKPVSEEKKEAPAELPAIDEKKPEEKAEKKEEPKEDNDDLLNEFKKYKEDFKGDGEKKEVSAPKEVEKSVDAPHEEPIKEPKEGISNNIHELAEGTNKLEDETGFFSELLSVVKNQGINDSILNQDLLKRMKDHWYFHPKEKIKSENKDKLSGELLNKLSELKRAEERWIAQKRFIEDDKRILTEKERDIETKTEELHKILNQLRFYEPASEEAAFWFDNGMVAKNLHELMNLLEMIDDKTFSHHMGHGRNDFSDWIRDVAQNKELAKKISHARTREEALIILENASMGNVYSIDPENYFRLNNGKVIRDVKDLIMVLKGIDDSLFKSHVNKEKNDFSLWIRDVFKNDYVADRLHRAKSRDHIIKLLEEFYKVTI